MLRIQSIGSAGELRAHAAAWDDLWLRSPVSTPRARAALVATWLEQFAPAEPFRAIVAEWNGEFVAALPLLMRRVKSVLPVASLPSNPWASCGEWLIDLTSPHAVAAAHAITRHMIDERWPIVWLDFAPLDRPDWRLLLGAFGQAKLALATRPQLAVGTVDRQVGFAHYEQHFARRFRRNRRRNAKLLETAGGAAFRCLSDLAPAEARATLLRGFAVERRSWKGAQGTSVLQHPGPLEYYLREAEQLAAWNGLELTFLDLAGEAIAFQYGICGKGTHFIAKCGYDAAYSRYGPGVQLMARTIEALHAHPTLQQIDFCGPLVPWTAEFMTGKYDVARVVVSPCGGVRSAAVRFYKTWYPRIKRLRAACLAGATTEPPDAAATPAFPDAPALATAEDGHHMG